MWMGPFIPEMWCRGESHISIIVKASTLSSPPPTTSPAIWAHACARKSAHAMHAVTVEEIISAIILEWALHVDTRNRFNSSG